MQKRKNWAKSYKTTSCLLDWEFLILGFWRDRAYGLWEKKPIWLLPLHLLWSSTCSSKDKKKRKLVWKFKASRLGNYPN